MTPKNHPLCIVLVIVCTLASVAILCHGIVHHFPNIDEVAHLPSGLSHWKYERFEMYRVNPPLVRMVAAFPNWLGGVDPYEWKWFSDGVGERPEFLIGRVRRNDDGPCPSRR